MPDSVLPRSPAPMRRFKLIDEHMVGDQIGLSEAEKVQRRQIAEKAYKEGLWAPMS